MKCNKIQNAYFILHTIYQNLLFPISGVNQPRETFMHTEVHKSTGLSTPI